MSASGPSGPLVFILSSKWDFSLFLIRDNNKSQADGRPLVCLRQICCHMGIRTIKRCLSLLKPTSPKNTKNNKRQVLI